jgi:outer membrane protein assembly factor BamB
MMKKALTIGTVLVMIAVAFTMMANVSGDGVGGSMKERWVNQFGEGYAYSYINPVIDSQGNVISAGHGDTTSTTYDKWIILKHDSSGNLIWKRNWGYYSNEYYYMDGLAIDEFDNIYAYGDADNPTYDDIWVVKFSPLGSVLWQRSLGWYYYDYAYYNCITYDNGYVYVAGYGYAYGSTAFSYDMYTFCLNANSGSLIWQQTWHSPFYAASRTDYVRGIVVEGNNVITGGYGYWTSSLGYEMNLVAYNKYTGGLVWQNHYGATTSSQTDYMYDMCSDGAGKVFICGYSYGAGYGADYTTAAFSATSGSLLWSDQIDGASSNSYDYAYSVAVDPVAGQVYTTGSLEDGTSTYDDRIGTVCYDSTTGALLWKNAYQSTYAYYAYGYSIAVGPSGTAYVCGYARYNSVDYYDIVVLAITSSGSLKWDWWYDGYTTSSSDYDYGRGIYVDAQENIAVSGYGYGQAGNYDIITAMFGSGIEATCEMEPKSLNLDSNGNWVSFKVESFPENPEYSPNDVDPATCSVGGVNADLKFGTHNNNHFIGKADRLLVEDAVGAPGEEVEVDISGSLYDGTNFMGVATIKAILN